MTVRQSRFLFIAVAVLVAASFGTAADLPPGYQRDQEKKVLADVERTSFAGRIGAGITDLFMNALGYTWRDNASCLSGRLGAHADFLYADGAVSGHGVVLTEAHGCSGPLAKNQHPAPVALEASRRSPERSRKRAQA